MAKLRLVLWTAALAGAAKMLLSGVTARFTVMDDPPTAVMGVVRTGAGVLAVYLLVATVLAVRLPRVAPRFVRRLVASAVGAGLLITPMVASAETKSTRPPAEAAPVLRRVADAPSGDGSASDPPPTRQHDAGAASVDGEIEVVAGDHLWRIAERTLAARMGRPPTDAEIMPYWSTLIAANRDRLVTGDPNFIFVGQRFRIPS